MNGSAKYWKIVMPFFACLIATLFVPVMIFGQEENKPGEGVWANYDFKPGDRVIFSVDYAEDVVGNFPRKLEFVEGNMEVVDWNGEKFLRATSKAVFGVSLGEPLPERFTIEFNVSWNHGNQTLQIFPDVEVFQKRRPTPTMDGFYPKAFIMIDERRSGVDDPRGGGGRAVTNVKGKLTKGVVPIRVMVDGTYVKVYIDEKRVANVPNATLEHSNKLYFAVKWAKEENPVFVGPIRIAAGGRDLWQTLSEKGRVATQGIYFDIDSANIRPESTAVLTEIGSMLKDHTDLKLRIEGHTDNTGDDAHNMTLSQQRADAVRDYLIQKQGIDQSRLESKGLGETQPSDTNDTPEGRQNNRRVELVKL